MQCTKMYIKHSSCRYKGGRRRDIEGHMATWAATWSICHQTHKWPHVHLAQSPSRTCSGSKHISCDPPLPTDRRLCAWQKLSTEKRIKVNLRDTTWLNPLKACYYVLHFLLFFYHWYILCWDGNWNSGSIRREMTGRCCWWKMVRKVCVLGGGYYAIMFLINCVTSDGMV